MSTLFPRAAIILSRFESVTGEKLIFNAFYYCILVTSLVFSAMCFYVATDFISRVFYCYCEINCP